MMRQTSRKGRYFSYLLRLWETRDGERRIWYAVLEPSVGGEERGFASLEELFVFLRQVTEEGASVPSAMTDEG